MSKTLHAHLDGNSVLTVWFDHVGKSVNTFSLEALGELENLVAGLERDGSATGGVIFTSAKADGFISGADLFEMANLDSDAVSRFVKQGQDVFCRIARLPMPTVAAINGHCLGGGFELALACRARVAADRGSINIGLPEIKLGIIPAWGGTTRMTRMLGPIRALPLLLTGKTMSPRKAMRSGVIDEVVRPEALLAAARRLLATCDALNHRRRPSMLNRVILAVPALTNVVCTTALRKTATETFGNYPAAYEMIDTVAAACRNGLETGLQAEHESITRLVDTDTCRNLMRLFFLRQESKLAIRNKLSIAGHAESGTEVRQAAVVGGGTMGAGIAHALIRSGISVRFLEVNEPALSAALQRVHGMIGSDIRSKRLSRLQGEAAMHLLSPATTASLEHHPHSLKMMNIVIEAVAERMDIKTGIFEKLDQYTPDGTVLASNTSSFRIAALANAVTNPRRVIGLHFFNPVSKMPLVEVVRTGHSDAAALRMGVELASRLGKTPILVADGPGFLVNRVLIPYLAEALMMASEGSSIVDMDREMKVWGMPMGPFELLDQVGLDVAMSILDSLSASFGEHVLVPEGIHEIVERGWLGRKSGCGFYKYGRKGRPHLNEGMAAMLTKSGEGGTLDSNTTRARLILPMVNEAARLLVEGVTDSADTIDLASVLGLGLAPFRGGLVHFAEVEGLDHIVEQMDQLGNRCGTRFSPCPELRTIAESGRPMQDLAAMESTARPASPAA